MTRSKRAGEMTAQLRVGITPELKERLHAERIRRGELRLADTVRRLLQDRLDQIDRTLPAGRP